METKEVENTVKQLCADASAQRGRRKFKYVLIQLKKFLHEHTEVAANCRRPARQGRRILLAPQQAFRTRQRSGTR